MAREKSDDFGPDPRSGEPGLNVPGSYPEDPVPPEAPTGLNPSDTPIVPDSPRRALDAGRFGNPRKGKIADQPANSDSVTDDEPMEAGDEQAVRDAEGPDSTDPGVSRSISRPRKREP